LFGTPSAAPTSSIFGGQQQQQQQQIPAHAAMLAHLNAEKLQEAERVRIKLEKLYLAYTGNEVVPEDSMESAKFVAITYNSLSPEQRQLQLIHGMALGSPGGQRPILLLPRPPQVSGRDWKLAVVNNPDPDNYVPLPLIGASSLQARVSWQQERAKEAASNAQSIQHILDFIRQREAATRQDLLEKERKYIALRHRLLDLMSKVELVRCLNKPLQPDEYRAVQRLQSLLVHVDHMRKELEIAQDQAKTQQQHIQKHLGKSGTVVNGMIPDKDALLKVLNEQRRKLSIMTDTAKKDLKDVSLVGQRVVMTR
jgi:hypothetical protein